jgi:hypothetical protein
MSMTIKTSIPSPTRSDVDNPPIVLWVAGWFWRGKTRDPRGGLGVF